MADRSDENKKEFSIEELNAWNVEKLRKYLKNRGVVITSDTRKRDNDIQVCLNTTNGDILTGECGCLSGYGAPLQKCIFVITLYRIRGKSGKQ